MENHVEPQFPQAYVVPIFSVSPAGSTSAESKRAFCGTGFFVGAGPRWLVTCRHCVDSKDENVSFYYMTLESKTGLPSKYLATRDVGRPRLHPKVDVAVFDVQDTGYLGGVRLSSRPISWMQDFGCVEFSATYAVPGTTDIERRTRFHKGHVTGRHFRNDVPHYTTSFRAFEGASGAPVLWERDGEFYAVGMIVGENEESTGVERFLARREVERDGQKVIEQNWYLLPTGEAIEGEALLAALTELGASPAVE